MQKSLFIALASMALSVSSCVPAPRTQIMVRLDADEALRAEIRVVTIEVFSGPPGEALEHRYDEDKTVEEWPLDVALVPFDRDPTRDVLLIATALPSRSMDAIPIARARIDTAFVRGRTLRLDARFESACRGVSCEGETTCVAGRCVSSRVDPGALPDLLYDAGTPPDATFDANLPALPDVWSPPVREAGQTCDLAGSSDVCASGTACTCTGERGCESGGDVPRCWRSSDIGCGRPIDLTARVERDGSFTIDGDGAGAPDLVPSTCVAAGGELVYLLRAPTADYRVNVTAFPAGMEFWYGCMPDMTWGRCTDTWNFMVPRGGAAYVLVEGSGAHQLRVQRLPP